MFYSSPVNVITKECKATNVRQEECKATGVRDGKGILSRAERRTPLTGNAMDTRASYFYCYIILL